MQATTLKLRNVKAYIPEYPVGTAEECADMIHEFLPIARAIDGLKQLKDYQLWTSSTELPWHVMHQSNSFTTLALRLKRTQSLTYLKHSTTMQVIQAYP